MKRRLVTTLLIAVLGLAAAPFARATHFDGSGATGSFDPQLSVAVSETRASRPGNIQFELTQADHEDPSVITTLRTPADWQYTFEFIRRARAANGSLTNRCNDTIDNRNNSADGTGQPGGPTDFSKRTDAFVARAEKIGTAYLEVHADTVSRPGPPISFRGDIAFVSFNPATNTANLCLMLKLIVDTTDPNYSASNQNAKQFADPIPSDSDEVESVTEITTDFRLIKTATSWETVVDLTDLVQTTELQTLQVSILKFRAQFLGATAGNWNPEGSIPFARAPGTSGSKTFSGVFSTCPNNDPDWQLCQSGRPTVTRNVGVNITPAAGIIVPINTAACTDSVEVRGTAEPNALVRLFDGATAIRDVTASATGAWQTREALAPGSHTLLARMIGTAGDDSEAVTINVSLPSPSIAEPLESTIVDPGALSVSGTSPAGTRIVTVLNGASAIASTVPADSGAWSATVTLSPRTVPTLTATAMNLCGIGAPSAGRTITVTSVRPSITSPASGAFLNTSAVTLVGTAEPGAAIAISDAAVIATATADGAGAWSAPVTLAEGFHPLTATATIGGFESLPRAHPLTIDLTAPDVPVITAPADGSTLEPLITFTGVAEPSSRVRLYESGAQVGPTATATGAGTWSIQAVLDIGARTVIARATDLAGNVSGDSAAVNLTIIDPLKILSPVEGTSHPAKVPFNIETSPAAVEVILYENGTEIARRPVANRRFIGQITFTGGEHTITVRTRAADNSLSNETQPRTFIVDAVQPTVTVNSIGGTGVNLLNPQLTGTAADSAAFDTGVARIELTYRGRAGGTFSQRANCPLCTGGTVAWNATPSDVINMPGVYDAFITAFDAVGNASQIGRTTFVITS